MIPKPWLQHILLVQHNVENQEVNPIFQELFLYSPKLGYK